MVDYVPILTRAIDALDPNTEETRRVLYERARHALAERLRDDGSVLRAESAALETAIEHVESEASRDDIQAEPDAAYPYDQPSERVRDWRTLLDGRNLRRSIVGASLALVVLLASAAVYSFWPQRASVARNVASKPEVADEPAKSIGYFYLRQPVYYRTSHPVGTLIVDKSQNFLYVVGPNVSALRYGIGVGPECSATAGLYRIMRKEEWPGWKPSNGQSAPAPDERKKIPFGARALYLSQDYRIHGSDSPAWFGRPIPNGCIRLVDDDVIHLYNRVPLETRVVVQN